MYSRQRLVEGILQNDETLRALEEGWLSRVKDVGKRYKAGFKKRMKATDTSPAVATKATHKKQPISPVLTKAASKKRGKGPRLDIDWPDWHRYANRS